MNDDQLLTAVRDSFAEVRLDVPVEQTARRGRVLRGRSRAYRAAGLVGAAAIAGVTAVALIGPGRAVPSGSARLDAWTVTKGVGGTVTVTLRQLLAVTGLQSALRADGVPVRVVVRTGMPSSDPTPPSGCRRVTMSDVANANLQEKILGGAHANMAAFAHGIAITFDSREIPAGVGIDLVIQPLSDRHFGWSLDLVQASPACTG